MVKAEITTENVENQSAIGNFFNHITSNKEIDCYLKYSNETLIQSIDGKLLFFFKLCAKYIKCPMNFNDKGTQQIWNSCIFSISMSVHVFTQI